MLPSKQAEEAIVSNFNETEQDDREEEREDQSGFSFKSALWHGGSVYDAWFSCASNQVHKHHIIHKTHIQKYLSSFNISSFNYLRKTVFVFLGFPNLQVAQVLLTLPYSFSQLGMVSGILFQIFYGILGSWTAYLISILYVEYRTRKEKKNVSFKNHVIQVSN